MRGAFGANRRVIFAVSRTCRIATRMCRGAEPTTSACAVDEPAALVRVRRKEVTVAAQPPFVLLRTVPASRARPWTSLAETGRPPLLPVATTSRADPGCHIHRPGR